ncbi:ABC transporter permease [Leadbettera azotonutricia]|uniref:D-ribose high-affinity transport system n=1 Tax=Leadbettera azotonutricia (strain ATCC BAA-888 / DSM 13862 / ZAS-9) TaxID=545695 RepID=F5YG48_LEAAZ|nr:ABC transporter permease [Leadbettera azotonutricia]AEF81405.1 D-ribose high-affinity transport system [Leadbettera azotonutricia ZAS-9]
MNTKKILTAEAYLGLFLLAILLLLAVFTKGFFSINNVMSMLNRFSYVLIAAIGMNLIIITSNIDVSAGALISVVCLVLAALGKLGLGLPVLLPAAIITGGLLSLINAVFITKFRIPAIVATLATAQLFSGILPLVVEGSLYDLPASFTWLAFEAKIFGIFPASVLLMFIIAIAALVFMNYSRLSKKIYAVGNNPEAARLAGIDVNKVVIIAYVIAGCLFGITGTIIATAGQRVTTTMGTGLEMTFIAAVVLGGTSVAGGSGKILGTIFGTAVLSVISPATNYLGISSDWSDAIMGAIIIVAVIVSALRKEVRHG